LINSSLSSSAQLHQLLVQKGTKGQEAAAWAATQIGGTYVWGGGHDTTGASHGKPEIHKIQIMQLNLVSTVLDS